MRILLTGASGFIGQHLLQALLAEGHHVVCAQRRAATPAESGAGAGTPCATIHADFAQDTDESAWLARIKGSRAASAAASTVQEGGRRLPGLASAARLHHPVLAGLRQRGRQQQSLAQPGQHAAGAAFRQRAAAGTAPSASTRRRAWASCS
ncbi:NAD-dependent epimerase/dehydratase family protein [Massilia sp. UMI-21]|nr:NAD-dependent epimerase/dehydratase family protein [Massilia sp. UMI-21]